MKIHLWIVLLLNASNFDLIAQKGKIDIEYGIEARLESTIFPQSNQFEKQESFFPSIAIEPTVNMIWGKKKNQKIVGHLFGRVDRDDRRTHTDVRELYYQYLRKEWEFNLGAKKIFWGVSESNHLVDIINQTDQVESPSGEDKLGQPLISVTFSSISYGEFSLYYLPVHRRLQFPGELARLRFGVPIERSDVAYRDGVDQWTGSFALRWSHYFDIVDVGFSQYYGVGQQPIFTEELLQTLSPQYDKIFQPGLDLQVTLPSMLIKTEMIYRYNDLQSFFASVVGLEYTFGNVNGKGLDIGAVGEFSYDGRELYTLTGLDRDLFLGTRITWNDIKNTNLLVGVVTDLSKGSTSMLAEFQKILNDRFSISLQSQLFLHVAEEDLILQAFKRDSNLRAELMVFF